MTRYIHFKRFLIACTLLFVLIGAQPFARAQAHRRTLAGYDLDWWTVDGGGVAPAPTAGYSVGGSAGQPDAATWRGGRYTLAGGFWRPATAGYEIYLPLVLRSI